VDLLITDVRLPGIDGLELASRCQVLRRRPGIIFVTGSQTPSLPDDLDRLNILGVIEKPLVLNSLAPLLATILRQQGGGTA
jgi:CheY-like chemotaxis protein